MDKVKVKLETVRLRQGIAREILLLYGIAVGAAILLLFLRFFAGIEFIMFTFLWTFGILYSLHLLILAFRIWRRSHDQQEGVAHDLQGGPPNSPAAGQEHKQFADNSAPTTLSQDSLSTRELEILAMLAKGLGTAAISQTLVISESTVRNHINSILSKLDCHSRVEAIAAARRFGLL